MGGVNLVLILKKLEVTKLSSDVEKIGMNLEQVSEICLGLLNQ